ncbi:MAG: TIM barrel protein [Oscillospiraceae bacterium]|jgi:deoxyribonuclease-4|nr:TIM barrel protein [Oscillospiraceae bacterium]
MIRFGPAGSDDSYTGRIAEIPAYLADFGLNAFEAQCGHGVRMGEAAARTLRANAERFGIALSVHSPYFISLSNPERLEGNIGYLRQTAQLAGWLGASRIVVHMGAAMGQPRRAGMEHSAYAVRAALDTAKVEGWPEVFYCLETMGKINQLGTVEEVLTLCGLSESLLPCVDFGHLYARSLGAFDGYDAYMSVLGGIENALGAERAKLTHIHFSHIAFGKGGESKHQVFADEGGGPGWNPLAALLAERGYRSTVICESRGAQTQDAALMKSVYEEFLK